MCQYTIAQEFTDFSNRNVQGTHWVHYGLNFLAYLGHRIWELLPNNLKRLESVEAFKSKVIEAGYLKTAHAEFVNHISTKWALYRLISIGFYLIYFYQLIGLLMLISLLFWLFYYFISFVLYA